MKALLEKPLNEIAPFGLIGLIERRMGKVRIRNFHANYTFPVKKHEEIDLITLYEALEDLESVSFDNESGFRGSKPIYFTLPGFGFQLFSSGKVSINRVDSFATLLLLDPFFKQLWVGIKPFVKKRK